MRLRGRFCNEIGVGQFRIYPTPRMGAMTLGEKLLDLTIEYGDSKANRSSEHEDLPGKPAGREPE